ncbi:ATP-binding protein [Sphingomonas sp. GB1N7]|uniref:ATP-binding protein n=1 Tax=Parasphingomonas caseinilytica TaxID=3096158 RepID=UPI002FC898C1
MTGFRPSALLHHAVLILALAAAIVPPRADAQVPQTTAQAGTQFDVMIADAKAQMMSDPVRTIAKAKQAEAFAQTFPRGQKTVAIATAQWLQGEAYLRLDRVAEAGPMIDRALAAVSHNGRATKLNGDILLSRGGYHTAKADVAAALSDYQGAHDIFRDAGETRSRAIALLSIAGLYQDSMDYEKALKYYQQALEVYRGDPQLSLSIYNNRGIAFKELGRYDQANVAFGEALKLAQKKQSPALELPILRNLARSELAAGRLDLADKTIAKGFAEARDIRNGPLSTQMWDIAAKAELLRGHPARALPMIERSFAGVDLQNTTISYREPHETAFQIYRALHNGTEALVHLEALKRLDDRTWKLAASANTSLASARFDFANQELRIAKLKADELQRNIDFERAQAKTRQNIALGLSAIAVMIVGLLTFGIVTLRRSRNQVRAANIDLAATNSALGKALAAKTEFLATTSHEIRTPLNGILGMTQVMLADRALTDQIRDRIGVVHSAGVTMRALVDDILDVAKMETGNLTIEHVPLDLKATLNDVARLWQEQAAGKGIGFLLDLDQSPAWIAGDAARLRQIVFNLLSNALKFTEAGAVTLRAAAVGERLRITVIDSGIGIPADKYELIFESFRQVDAGTTRRFGGTGLGLAICRNLARAMDGDVRVESEIGVGSSFIIDLPLTLATAPEEVAEVSPEKALLIVDRSPITRSMLRAMVETRAGTVIFAASAEEAVEKLHSGQVAQVLIDDATIRAAPDRDAALSAIATAAIAVNAATSLLWAAPDDSDHGALCATGIGQVIAKPIAGAALIEKLYVSDGVITQPLVSRAA